MVTREMIEKLSYRKSLLFTCHCCREIWDLLTDERSKQAVELIERHIDQPVSKAELAAAASAAADAADAADATYAAVFADHAAANAAHAAYAAANAVAYAAANATDAAYVGAYVGAHAAYAAANANAAAAYAANVTYAAYTAANVVAVSARRVMHQKQLEIYNEILAPAITFIFFHDQNVRAVAQAIYNDNDWGATPVLADALEDINTGDIATVIEHLRNYKQHKRGCWVVDMILNKH